MPIPTTKLEVRSFLGLANYLGKFIRRLSDKAEVLRDLTTKRSRFVWTEKHTAAFNEIKDSISEETTLVLYDVNKPVVLQVDASGIGLGACLLQEGKPVAFASAALNQTQRRYSQIEKELLAIVFGCKRFHSYIYGKDIKVETDHRPLENIFKKNLDRNPARLQRMVLDLQKYRLDVKWIKGEEMLIADALSRMTVPDSEDELDDKHTDIEIYSLNKPISLTDNQMAEFKSAIENNAVEKKLLNYVKNGWPIYHKDVHTELQKFWNEQDEFTHFEDILIKGNRVYIPKKLRASTLDDLHAGHFGITKTLQRARETVYWPGMTTDITKKISPCEICLENADINNKEPMKYHEIPSRAWQKVSMDFFALNKTNYLVIADYFSSFMEIFKVQSMTTKVVIEKIKDVCSRYGVPEQIVSDNGKSFISEEFKDFAKDFGFELITSSPKYPESNGKAESAVKMAKKILIKSSDWKKALMDYHASPIVAVGKSPAEMMYGRRIRTCLPATSEMLKRADDELVKNEIRKQKEKQKEYYDRNAGRNLKELKPGNNAWMKPLKKGKAKKVIIEKKLPHRSYLAKDEQGQIYRRNRKFFRTSN